MEIKIYRQHRRSMMARATHGAIEVFIPRQLSEHSKQVQAFISESVQKLALHVPDIPHQQTTRAQIEALITRYSQRLQVTPQRVQFRDMTRKWGSCSSKGSITLNSRLYWLDVALAEYIVCHELAHLIELNHSPAFWKILADHMPDYPERILALRKAEKALWEI